MLYIHTDWKYECFGWLQTRHMRPIETQDSVGFISQMFYGYPWPIKWPSACVCPIIEALSHQITQGNWQNKDGERLKKENINTCKLAGLNRQKRGFMKKKKSNAIYLYSNHISSSNILHLKISIYCTFLYKYTLTPL